MKVFRYSGFSRSTMTVKELREKLAECPDDMPVFAEWESCLGFVSPDAFDVKRAQKFGETFDALVINVNDY